MPQAGRLQGELLTECAGWIWEQMLDEGFQLQGELVELILETERELGIHAAPLAEIAARLEGEFQLRGVASQPHPMSAPLIRTVLDWEDDFLGFAGIPRAES